MSLSSRLSDSLTCEVVSSSSSKLTLLNDSPISELVMNPDVREILTDWLIEFICSERCSTVLNVYQFALSTARGSSDLISYILRPGRPSAPRFMNLTSWRRTLYLALLRLLPLVPIVDEAPCSPLGYSSSLLCEIDCSYSDFASVLSTAI